MALARRFLAVSGSTLLLGVLAAGPAAAAPIDFPKLQKYSGHCGGDKDGFDVRVEPMPGSGLWTPYVMDDGKTRRVLVPSSFTIQSDNPDLKARHISPGVPVSKPGAAGSAGSITCTFTGADAKDFIFTLSVTGKLT